MLTNPLIASTLVFAVAEPALESVDLTHYAITQGGLLIVVLVLLWMQSTQNRRKSAHTAETIAVLTGLVETNTKAMEALKAAVLDRRFK